MAMFDLRDIRRGMDVYNRGGDWLGTVLKVEGVVARPLLRLVTTYPSSSGTFNGELTGPISTQLIGNSGPTVQTAITGYGSTALPDGKAGSVLIGRWLGLTGRRWFDAGSIINISLERIVVESGRNNSKS